MYGQIALDIILLFMLYATGATTAAIACLYLLLRRGNAFAPDVTPPVRLRRWTAAFFASLALGHVWYMPAAVLTSDDDISLSMLIGGLLDCMVVIPLAIIVLLCMLQDRRRPLWPAFAVAAPLVVGMAVGIANHSYAIVPLLRIYLLLLGIGLIIYMVRAVRQYGRWLRDNYADLEHKEVWQSFVVLAVILLMFGIYVSGFGGVAYEYIIQMCDIALVCYLLWRVETLNDLSETGIPEDENTRRREDENTRRREDENTRRREDENTRRREDENTRRQEDENTRRREDENTRRQEDDGEASSSDTITDATYEQIGSMLKQHCEDAQLYLRHDLTVTQLAQSIGTNRFYLGQYFAHHDTTYNAYINNLRINHFIKLHQEGVADQRPFTSQQLAKESGFRSYSTFSLAFKQRMGQSVTA